MDGSSQYDAQRSPWRCTVRLLSYLGVGWVAALPLTSAGYACADSHSRSYQYGYSTMITATRQTIAEVNDELRGEGKTPDDSPAVLFGSDGHGIAKMCEANLEAATVGSTRGTEPPLPDNFSSADFLSGCTDAGKALLASG